MARYRREFLVPYLQNICALHLAEEKLIRRYNQLNNTASRIRYGKDNPKPVKENYEKAGCFTYGSLILGGIIWLCLVLLILGGNDRFGPMVFTFLFGLPFVVFGVLSLREIDKTNAAIDERYEAQMTRYIRVERQNESEAKNAIPYEQEMERCAQEIDRVIAVRDRMYGANIIPNKYRGIYPAVYLYDWFSSSQADDLDHALAMYVLEEIKSRLDTIIDNQSDMILNQRIMMANQQRSLQQQRSYENMMRAKLNQMHMTQEEQLRHTRMIESNTVATAYFAAANYIRNI